MKNRFSFVLAMLMTMLALTGAVLASPTLQAETGSLSAEIEGGEVDLNISELFVVKRGYAIPFVEKDLPAEYRNYEKIDYDMWHVNLYLVDTDEFVEAPVLAGEGCADLIVNDTLSNVYNRQYCKYTLYTSGIYVLEPVCTNTDASVLDGTDADAMVAATGDKNVGFELVEDAENVYSLVNANVAGNVTFSENVLAFYWGYNPVRNGYELVICSDMHEVYAENRFAAVNYVVKNNPVEGEADSVVFILGYEANFDTYIVSLSVTGIDDDGKYRNYYELFDINNGTKMVYVEGSACADTATSLTPALETGSVVKIVNNMVDEKAPAIGKIDSSDSSKGLVWISDVDLEKGVMSVVPTYVTENACCEKAYTTSLASYKFDAANPDVNFDGNQYKASEDGKIQYKITDNTVVSVLKYADAGEYTTKWGTMNLGTIQDVANSNKNYKCYNNKFEDKNGNLTTKYAKNIEAYVYGTDVSDGMVEADFVVVIVNKLASNQNGMFTKSTDCETHKTPRTIEQIRVFIAENDNLDDIPADNINIEMKVKNINHANDALFLLCTYDVNGVLLNTYCKVSEAGIGEYDTLTQPVDNTEGKIAFIKAFVFDTVSVLSPVAESITK